MVVCCRSARVRGGGQRAARVVAGAGARRGGRAPAPPRPPLPPGAAPDDLRAPDEAPRFLPLPQRALLYTSKYIALVSTTMSNDKVDYIDVSSEGDKLLGAELCDGVPLLFSLKHGVYVRESDGVAVSLRHVRRQLVAVRDRPARGKWQREGGLEARRARMGTSEAGLQVGAVGRDAVGRLKTAFLFHVRRDASSCAALLAGLVPPAPASPGPAPAPRDVDADLDRAVLRIASDMLDDVPAGDPRWKQRGGAATNICLGSSAALQLQAQLRDKQRALALFCDFLRSVGLWQRLGLVTTESGSVVSTENALAELADLLSMAIALRKLQQGPDAQLIDAAINQVSRWSGAMRYCGVRGRGAAGGARAGGGAGGRRAGAQRRVLPPRDARRPRAARAGPRAAPPRAARRRAARRRHAARALLAALGARARRARPPPALGPAALLPALAALPRRALAAAREAEDGALRAAVGEAAAALADAVLFLISLVIMFVYIYSYNVNECVQGFAERVFARLCERGGAGRALLLRGLGARCGGALAAWLAAAPPRAPLLALQALGRAAPRAPPPRCWPPPTWSETRWRASRLLYCAQTAASLGKLCAVAAEEDTESLARRLDARLALASQHAALPAALRLRHGLGPADCAVLPPDDLVQHAALPAALRLRHGLGPADCAVLPPDDLVQVLHTHCCTSILARRLDARLALASQHAALPAALRLRHGLGPADCAVLPPDDLVQVLHTLLYFNTGAAPGRAPGAGLAARRAARRAAPAPRPGARRLRRAAARRPRAGTTHIVVLQYWRGAWTRAWRWPRSTPRCPPRCACATAWGPPTAPCCRPTTSCRYYTHCCTSILARRLDARLALASQHAALPAALRLRHGLGPADCAVLPPDDLVQVLHIVVLQYWRGAWTRAWRWPRSTPRCPPRCACATAWGPPTAPCCRPTTSCRYYTHCCTSILARRLDARLALASQHAALPAALRLRHGLGPADCAVLPPDDLVQVLHTLLYFNTGAAPGRAPGAGLAARRAARRAAPAPRPGARRLRRAAARRPRAGTTHIVVLQYWRGAWTRAWRWPRSTPRCPPRCACATAWGPPTAPCCRPTTSCRYYTHCCTSILARRLDARLALASQHAALPAALRLRHGLGPPTAPCCRPTTSCRYYTHCCTSILARRLDARLALASQHAALPAALRLRHGLGPADCAVLPPDDLVQVLHTLLYFNTGAAPGRAPGAGLAARRAARRAAPAPRPGARRLRRAAARRPRAGTTHIVVLQYWRGAWTRAWRWPRSTPRCPPRCACATAWGPPTAPCCRPTTSCRYYTHCCTSILARRLDARLALASQHAALPAALRLRHGLGPADCAVLPPDDLVQVLHTLLYFNTGAAPGRAPGAGLAARRAARRRCACATAWGPPTAPCCRPTTSCRYYTHCCTSILARRLDARLALASQHAALPAALRLRHGLGPADCAVLPPDDLVQVLHTLLYFNTGAAPGRAPGAGLSQHAALPAALRLRHGLGPADCAVLPPDDLVQVLHTLLYFNTGAAPGRAPGAGLSSTPRCPPRCACATAWGPPTAPCCRPTTSCRYYTHCCTSILARRLDARLALASQHAALPAALRLRHGLGPADCAVLPPDDLVQVLHTLLYFNTGAAPGRAPGAGLAARRAARRAAPAPRPGARRLRRAAARRPRAGTTHIVVLQYWRGAWTRAWRWPRSTPRCPPRCACATAWGPPTAPCCRPTTSCRYYTHCCTSILARRLDARLALASQHAALPAALRLRHGLGPADCAVLPPDDLVQVLHTLLYFNTGAAPGRAPGAGLAARRAARRAAPAPRPGARRLRRAAARRPRAGTTHIVVLQYWRGAWTRAWRWPRSTPRCPPRCACATAWGPPTAPCCRPTTSCRYYTHCCTSILARRLDARLALASQHAALPAALRLRHGLGPADCAVLPPDDLVQVLHTLLYFNTGAAPGRAPGAGLAARRAARRAAPAPRPGARRLRRAAARRPRAGTTHLLYFNTGAAPGRAPGAGLAARRAARRAAPAPRPGARRLRRAAARRPRAGTTHIVVLQYWRGAWTRAWRWPRSTPRCPPRCACATAWGPPTAPCCRPTTSCRYYTHCCTSILARRLDARLALASQHAALPAALRLRHGLGPADCAVLPPDDLVQVLHTLLYFNTGAAPGRAPGAGLAARRAARRAAPAPRPGARRLRRAAARRPRAGTTHIVVLQYWRGAWTRAWRWPRSTPRCPPRCACATAWGPPTAPCCRPTTSCRYYTHCCTSILARRLDARLALASQHAALPAALRLRHGLGPADCAVLPPDDLVQVLHTLLYFNTGAAPGRAPGAGLAARRAARRAAPAPRPGARRLRRAAARRPRAGTTHIVVLQYWRGAWTRAWRWPPQHAALPAALRLRHGLGPADCAVLPPDDLVQVLHTLLYFNTGAAPGRAPGAGLAARRAARRAAPAPRPGARRLRRAAARRPRAGTTHCCTSILARRLDARLALASQHAALPAALRLRHGLGPADCAVLPPDDLVQVLHTLLYFNTGAAPGRAPGAGLAARRAARRAAPAPRPGARRLRRAAARRPRAAKLCCIGADVSVVVPPAEDVLTAPELAELAADSRFHYLLRYGYQCLPTATH
ncbi:hypothetical protein HF086_003214 [Spodoptera exigua]|uniref:Uncharacterized protein n=1 Tax=Spodoptera exigua TaxID=7107 RepID=A0A922MFE6_SPOEX|nr:hypothetical protein HF086_003214 [Spodoptera exigua]